MKLALPRVWQLVGVALIGALGSVACRESSSELVAVGTLERDRIELVAETHEPIVEIAVHEGERVHAGDVLLRLDDRRMRAQLEQARAARDQARARLAELLRGPRAERIAEARARLAGAESRVVMTRRRLERSRELVERSFETHSQLDDRQSLYDEALARRDEARAGLQALLAGTTPEELEQARSALANAEAERTDMGIRFERVTVRAPRAGVIDALPFEIGERPPAGATVVVMLAAGRPYARVYVPASLRVSTRPGQRAQVWIDGHSEPLRGRVRTVSSDAAFTPYFALTEHDRTRLSYVAEVDLVEGAAEELPTGLPVEVRFTPLPEGAVGATELRDVEPNGD